jgi:hypothetical protein
MTKAANCFSAAREALRASGPACAIAVTSDSVHLLRVKPWIVTHLSKTFVERQLMPHHQPFIVVPARPDAPGIIAEITEPGKLVVEKRSKCIRSRTGVPGDKLHVGAVPPCGNALDVVEIGIPGPARDQRGRVKVAHKGLSFGLEAALLPIGQFASGRDACLDPDVLRYKAPSFVWCLYLSRVCCFWAKQ